MPHDILEFRRHLRRRRDTLQRGKAFWRCQLYAALLLRRLAYDKPVSVARCTIGISNSNIYFEYYVTPSGAAIGTQRCCLASTLRIGATGVARAARYSRVLQTSPASPRYPPTWQGFLALPAICSAAASALGIRQACLCCTIGISNSNICLLYTSPSPRDLSTSRMPSSA